MEKQSNVFLGSNGFTQTVSVRPTILTHDKAGKLRVGVFNVYGVL